jgi:hypothetical protein
MMQLSIKGLAVTSAIVWGGCLLLVAIANAIWPTYGQAFLNVAASIYPGYKASRAFGDIVTGAVYAIVDGGIFGVIVGVIYNAMAKPKDRHHG